MLYAASLTGPGGAAAGEGGNWGKTGSKPPAEAAPAPMSDGRVRIAGCRGLLLSARPKRINPAGIELQIQLQVCDFKPVTWPLRCRTLYGSVRHRDAPGGGHEPLRPQVRLTGRENSICGEPAGPRSRGTRAGAARWYSGSSGRRSHASAEQPLAGLRSLGPRGSGGRNHCPHYLGGGFLTSAARTNAVTLRAPACS